MDSIFDMAQLTNMITAYAPKVAGAILTLIIGFWVIGWLVRMVKNLLAKNGVDETIRPFLASLVSVGLKVMLLLSVAGIVWYRNDFLRCYF